MTHLSFLESYLHYYTYLFGVKYLEHKSLTKSSPSRDSNESDVTILKTLLEKVAQDVQTLSYRQLQYETQLKEGDAQFALIQDEWKMVKQRDESNK